MPMSDEGSQLGSLLLFVSRLGVSDKRINMFIPSTLYVPGNAPIFDDLRLRDPNSISMSGPKKEAFWPKSGRGCSEAQGRKSVMAWITFVPTHARTRARPI